MPTESTPNDPGPDGRRILFGAWATGAPWNMDAVEALSSDTGHPIDIVHWYQGWGVAGSAPQLPFMDAVRQRGSVPMITWEPWDYRMGVDQPKYRLRNIARGDFDAYIMEWVQAMRNYGSPVYLRFGHEMNGNWYPWSVSRNGNTSQDFINAWRHIVSMFRDSGANNVMHVWNPNVDADGHYTPLTECFPGDAWVDRTGLDGYNGGSGLDWGGWVGFSDIFSTSYGRVRSLSEKPMVIGETSSSEQGGNKPGWIGRTFAEELPQDFPGIEGLVWFNEQKEADWRLQSSAATLTAAREALQLPYYRSPTATAMVADDMGAK